MTDQTNLYTIEFDDNAPDYRMVVIRLNRRSLNHRCGYVSVPREHPFYGESYGYEISFNCKDAKVNPTDPIGTFIAAVRASNDDSKMAISYAADVHGGITYANGRDHYPVEGEHWWFGFDAAYCDDDHDGG
jgi:hypothetical protein